MPEIIKKLSLFQIKSFFKKIFLNRLVPKNNLLLGVFIFLLLAGLFFPAFMVKANWLTDALLALPNLAITAIMQLLLAIGDVFLRIANWFLGFAISNPFDVPFTNPGENPVIKIGWTLLRDIVNMLFILGLAYIGLATSLNLGEFKTGTILKNLIIIALLVNFTPVICGVIVDISNIISNFFVQGVNFDNITNIYSSKRSEIGFFGEFIQNPSLLATAMILYVYAVIGGTILLLFALVFLVRVPIIWILVILSPLAFFFWIFPKTKKYFDKWWKQFLKWSFIVVPASFFLYLSQQVLASLNELMKSGGSDPAGGFLVQIAPYFVAIVFLIFGLAIVLKTSGAVGVIAQAALGAATGGLGAVAGIAGRGIGKGAKGAWKHKGAAWEKTKGAARAVRHPLKTYEAAKPTLKKGYEATKRGVGTGWQRAKHPIQTGEKVKDWWKEEGGKEKTVETLRKTREKTRTGIKAVGRGLRAALWQMETGKDKEGKPVYAAGMLKGAWAGFKAKPKKPEKALGVMYEQLKGGKKKKTAEERLEKLEKEIKEREEKEEEKEE